MPKSVISPINSFAILLFVALLHIKTFKQEDSIEHAFSLFVARRNIQECKNIFVHVYSCAGGKRCLGKRLPVRDIVTHIV